MLMTPRQLLAIGELYRNGGRANGRQIVPEAWVTRVVPRPRPRLPCLGAWAGARRGAPIRCATAEYGYGWWVHDIAGHETCFAWG